MSDFGYTQGDRWEAPWRGAKTPIIEAMHAAMKAADLTPAVATQTLSGLDQQLGLFQATAHETVTGVLIVITYKPAVTPSP